MRIFEFISGKLLFLENILYLISFFKMKKLLQFFCKR